MLIPALFRLMRLGIGRLSKDISHDFGTIFSKIPLSPSMQTRMKKCEIYTSKVSSFFRKAYTSYEHALKEKAPLLTTSLSISFTYMVGEGLAQYILKKQDTTGKTEYDFKRIATFGLYGVVLGGPCYYYWFKYLDQVGSKMMTYNSFVQSKLSAYANRWKSFFTFKYQGKILSPTEVEIANDTRVLLSKRAEKAIKILLDQLLFSSFYTLFFMTVIGKMTGKPTDYSKFPGIYAVDCVVWPPFQYFNFKYIPPHLQPIFVNGMNIGWNAFLSYSIGKAH